MKLIVSLVIVVFSSLAIIVGISGNETVRSRIFAAWEPAPSWMWPLTLLWPTEQAPVKSLKLSSFAIPSPTITPTLAPNATIPPGQPTQPPGWSTPVPTVPGGGPPGTTRQYCVDEDPTGVLIEACDDPTRCDIAHGAGGPSSACGTVIGWEHQIIESLLRQKNNDPTSPYGWNVIDAFPGKASTCFAAAPWQPYISTFNVIDAYKLAGFSGFDRGTHADATALTNAWKSTAGYTVTSTANGLTPGDAALFSNPPHVAIVNTVEIDANGNGSLWFLHTGATYYLGKLIIANWNVVASSTGDNTVTFGSHTSKVADDTRGNTTCYCGGGSICYEWKFKPL